MDSFMVVLRRSDAQKQSADVALSRFVSEELKIYIVAVLVSTQPCSNNLDKHLTPPHDATDMMELLNTTW